jgi:hypothetical protein
LDILFECTFKSNHGINHFLFLFCAFHRKL